MDIIKVFSTAAFITAAILELANTSHFINRAIDPNVVEGSRKQGDKLIWTEILRKDGRSNNVVTLEYFFPSGATSMKENITMYTLTNYYDTFGVTIHTGGAGHHCLGFTIVSELDKEIYYYLEIYGYDKDDVYRDKGGTKTSLEHTEY